MAPCLECYLYVCKCVWVCACASSVLFSKEDQRRGRQVDLGRERWRNCIRTFDTRSLGATELHRTLSHVPVSFYGKGVPFRVSRMASLVLRSPVSVSTVTHENRFNLSSSLTFRMHSSPPGVVTTYRVPVMEERKECVRHGLRCVWASAVRVAM